MEISEKERKKEREEEKKKKQKAMRVDSEGRMRQDIKINEEKRREKKIVEK